MEFILCPHGLPRNTCPFCARVADVKPPVTVGRLDRVGPRRHLTLPSALDARVRRHLEQRTLSEEIAATPGPHPHGPARLHPDPLANLDRRSETLFETRLDQVRPEIPGKDEIADAARIKDIRRFLTDPE